MAGGMDLGDSGGKGGKKKKPLDTAINLVPFIDLMACTIAFLIMTAVWTQIGRLQVSQSGGPSDPNQQQDDKQIPPLTLLITEKELKMTAGATAYDPIPITRDATNKIDLSKLQAKIKEIKASIPDEAQITLQNEDAVKYEDLVRIIDECIGDGLPNVAVSPAMG